MKLVYIAGPYRGTCVNSIRRNIAEAAKWAEFVWTLGHAALCPHMNSAFMDGATSDENFLAGCKLMLTRCDVMYVMEGFRSSSGTIEEIQLAQKQGLPIVYDMNQLIDILQVRKYDHCKVIDAIRQLHE